VLLTAHHRDDQAETLVLQLLRGAGPHGLAAMPVCVAFSRGWHLRPLLDFRRGELEAYAREQGLGWIEDTSNLDTRIPRNFLRHRLLPALEHHWPAAVACLARSAQHAGEAAEILDEIAAADVRGCAAGDDSLSLATLSRLTPERRRNLLRWWLRQAEGHAPPAHLLDEIVKRIETEPATRHASVRLARGEVRRYRDRVWYVPRIQNEGSPLPSRERDRERGMMRASSVPEPVMAEAIPWDLQEPLAIPGTAQQLRAIETVGAGLSQARVAGQSLEVRLRAGGETFRPSGRDDHRKLKKLLQGSRLAPWQRARLPLVYVNDTLAAVGDRWIADGFAAQADEPGWVLLIEQCR
jgi:tRNA(Ile)-lysidine synthase